MKAEELKLYNQVLCRGALSVVTSIDKLSIGYLSTKGKGEKKIPIRLVKPIPLTEENIVKFGGVVSEYDNFVIKAGDFEHSIKNINDIWWYSIDKSDAECYRIVELRFLHELQNVNSVFK